MFHDYGLVSSLMPLVFFLFSGRFEKVLKGSLTFFKTMERPDLFFEGMNSTASMSAKYREDCALSCFEAGRCERFEFNDLDPNDIKCIFLYP